MALAQNDLAGLKSRIDYRKWHEARCFTQQHFCSG